MAQPVCNTTNQLCPAYAYDATQLLMQAIESVAVVGQNGALVVGRGALRDWLSVAEQPGLTGTLRCAPTGDCAATIYGVYELDTAVRNNAFWPRPLSGNLNKGESP